MPDLPVGPLLSSVRYSVHARDAHPGFFHRQAGEVHLPALPGLLDEERLTIEIRSINYAAFDLSAGEPFANYVARRRRDVRREAALLASYKELSAHVPQIVDLVVGECPWDPALRNHALEQDEPILLLERLEATPLGALSDIRMSQEEVLEMAEKLLRILRVFHMPDREGHTRFFLSLTPDDVLLDRATRTYWVQNLWKLRTNEELGQERVHCSPGEQAFVSPALAPFLHNPPAVPASSKQQRMATIDLYSLGVLLYCSLAESPDLTDELPGFLEAGALDDLQAERQLDPRVTDFLRGLIEYRFVTATKALEALAPLRGVSAYESYLTQPPRVMRELASAQLATGDVLDNRYEVLGGLSQGGQGSVFLGRDLRTHAQVVLKVPYYPEADLDTLENASDADRAQVTKKIVHDRRGRFLDEARLALRLHGRTGSVPQLLDVVLLKSNQSALQQHPEPAVRGHHEPVLVFEYVAGLELGGGREYTQRALLELAWSMGNVLASLHRPDANGNYYLYVDWKPPNVLRHPETGNCTFVDLGSVLRIENGRYAGALASTDLYAGLEEYKVDPSSKRRVLNHELRPSYDFYGMGAVLWQLAARPVKSRLLELRDHREDLRRQGVLKNVFPISEIPSELDELSPILERALQPKPEDRFASADELMQAIRAALGRMSPLAPEAPLALRGQAVSSREVALEVEPAPDPFCEHVVVYSGTSPIQSPTGKRVKQWDVTPSSAVLTHRDRPAGHADRVYYAAFSLALNGLVSPARSVAVDLIAAPANLQLERAPLELRLTWEVPDILHQGAGEVVVLADGQEVYAGRGTELVRSNLDPEVVYSFTVFSRLPYGESTRLDRSARPLPVLETLSDMTSESGDRRVTLRWAHAGRAANRMRIVRTLAPIAHAEGARLDDAELRSLTPDDAPDPIEFDLAGSFEISGASGAQLELVNGRLHGEWIDEDAAPATRYHYTVLFSYDDGPVHWVGPSVSEVAFAEVSDPSLAGLPGALRLQWTAPAGADLLVLERQSADGVEGAEWELAPDSRVFVDRDVPVGTPVEYRLRTQFGATHSPGIALSGLAPEVVRVLPRLSLVPGPGNARVWVDFQGLPAEARLELQLGDDVSELASRSGGDRQVLEQALRPWKPATLAVFGAQAEPVATAPVTPYDEVEDLGVFVDGARIEATWYSPHGCAGTVVILEGAGRVQTLPASQQSCRFEHLEPGEYRVSVRTLTDAGAPSHGRWSDPVSVTREQETATA